MFDTSGCLCNTRSCCPSSAPAQDLSVPKWRNWQTRMVQVHVPARVWGFESLLRHQFSQRALFSVLWFREDTLALLWQYKSGDRHLRQKEVFLMANTKVLLLRYCRLDSGWRGCVSFPSGKASAEARNSAYPKGKRSSKCADTEFGGMTAASSNSWTSGKTCRSHYCPRSPDLRSGGGASCRGRRPRLGSEDNRIGRCT